MPAARANGRSGRDARQALWHIAACAIVPVLLIVVYSANVGPWKRGDLVDSDCYVHLVRAEKLWTTRDWFDSVIERANAPYGDELHWTRPFDLLLLVGAGPASLFVGLRTALFWWGVIVSPVLLFCTLLALRWAVRPLLSEKAASLAAFFLIANLGLIHAFLPGRPDHHGLLVFLFVLSIGFMLRLLKQPFGLALCYGAGAVAGLSVWVSIESTAAVAVSLATLALAWAARGGPSLGKSFHYSLALALSTAVALLIERPPADYGAVEADRISIMYVTVFVLVALVWAVIAGLARRTTIFNRPIHRFAGLVVGAGATALVVWLVFPKFYRSPLADVDPEVAAVYVRNVTEMKPLFASEQDLEVGVPLIGAALLAVPFAFFATKRRECNSGWMYVGSTAVLFVLLTVLQQRWGAYAEVALTIALAELVAGSLAWLDRNVRGFPRLLTRAMLQAMCWLALAFSGVLAAKIVGDPPCEKENVPLGAICRHLQDAQRWQGRQLRIVTHTFWGGELLYRTRHGVIGTPYHRNTAGILDTYRVLTAATDAEALAIIRERGIDTILLYPGTREARLYCERGEVSTLYQRLCEHSVPSWCRPVELPQELSPALLFEVLPP